ncbi:UDP-N-acetylglucosamine 1-carboxyvinyltransferase [Gloeomargarita lithophora Alchichica-D10]|uniref:UDP-N-acetylglucosamine 1-carboxyvinyltransferase n=1 Tax=Gloeomargarita lithophora Alchichica-D10 TaxID=1188229 RepID=A0A1J0ABP9_9CYAN|nr:UDP-N-acetylglucosamine 1-carboxyvinyltransferase [Gloeomargarita lithophora]APB33329.1 UDP-N-acetylglucosamine 1-carboxyvinyltransferase [Gloeomargarita lithophora Alchichica-D10]
MTTQVGELLTTDSVLRIRGGVLLRGEVGVNGAKNSALAIMAGALLCSQECRIRNVPNLVDVHRMGQVLTALGVKVRYDRGALELDVTHLHRSLAPYEIVSQLRASFFVIGPLLARLGVARVPMPGGCAIGARPVELHVRGLQALGAVVQIEHGMVHAYARKLKGANIYLDYPSVGATETLMMAATLAEGETVIENAAQEPEVVDLANFCRSMGAKIRGAGTKTITVVGVPRLHTTEYSIIPDRIEAGTFMVAAAITRSDVLITPVIPEHLTPVIAKLNEIGFQATVEAPNGVRVQPGAGVYQGTDIETLPFPGFPTDMQAQFMALLTLSEGSSVVTETVFENRLRHVAELQRLGANIRVKGNHAVIQGVPFLSGAPVTATDLRASAALVLAGLAAQGETVISGLHHLDRGYERLEEKLRSLGADLVRVAA